MYSTTAKQCKTQIQAHRLESNCSINTTFTLLKLYSAYLVNEAQYAGKMSVGNTGLFI